MSREGRNVEEIGKKSGIGNNSDVASDRHVGLRSL